MSCSMATEAWLIPCPRKAPPSGLLVSAAVPSTRTLGTRYSPQEKMQAWSITRGLLPVYGPESAVSTTSTAKIWPSSSIATL